MSPREQRKGMGESTYPADLEDPDIDDDTTCADVGRACCVHDAKGWGRIGIHFFFILFFLYFFLFSLLLLGDSAKIIGGCAAGALFGDVDNPIAGLCIGVLATVFLQSSSTTTSIVVGLAGTSAIDTQIAIYVIMGANIGTSVTNTIVALGQMGDGDQLERAFAAATVHDMFNWLAVFVLLPIEVISNYLYYLTEWLVSGVSVSDGDKWEGPVKLAVAPLAQRMIKPNKSIISDVAEGISECADYYPTKCMAGGATYENCQSKAAVAAVNATVGLIGCDKKAGYCPVFFQEGADQGDDEAAGWVCFIISIIFLVVCLFGLVKVLSSLLGGVSAKIITKATNVPGIVSMAIGAGITILVQSSSITTSVLTPLAGMDLIKLEQMYPLTLGANLGTTVTALLASMVSDKVEALQIALAHLFFNISGILIWYPIPFMRRIPLKLARWLGLMTRRSRYFPILYLLVGFILFPLTLLGMSILFTTGSKSWTALGVLVLVLLTLGVARFCYYLWWQGGKQQLFDYLDRKGMVADAVSTLPEELLLLKTEVARLNKKSGLMDLEAPVIPLRSRASIRHIEHTQRKLMSDAKEFSNPNSAIGTERFEKLNDLHLVLDRPTTPTVHLPRVSSSGSIVAIVAPIVEVDEDEEEAA